MSASSAEYSAAVSTRHLVEADLRRALAGDVGVADRLDVEVPPREVVHVVRLVRLEHVRLEQRVVRDAGQRDAVVGEHVLVVLDVLPELGAGTDRRTTARARRACGRDRAGPARRCSDARAGCSRRGPARCRTKGRRRRRQRVEAGRLGVEADELGRRERVPPALERGFVDHRFVVARRVLLRRVRGRIVAARTGARSRAPPRRRWRRRDRALGASLLQVAQPAPEFEALEQRRQRVFARRRRSRGRRARPAARSRS